MIGGQKWQSFDPLSRISDYKYGVQLCDEFSVLISFSLPSSQIRKKLISLLHEGIWETKEIINFTAGEGRPPLSPGSYASTSSRSSLR